MGKFGDQIKRHERVALARIRATARESIRVTTEIAQQPRRGGGRMRIRTGFLRASIQAAIGRMPSGPTTNEGDQKYGLNEQASGAPVAAVLLQYDPFAEVSFYVGWTANYARPREYKDGFLRGAVEKWDTTVARAANQAKRKIK